MQRAHDAGSLLSERISTPEFASASTLGRIQQSGIIRVGVIADAPGFCSLNAETHRFEGLDIAVARKLVQSIFGGTMFMANRNIEFVQLELVGRAEALVERNVDIVAAVFAVTEERRKLVDFTDPYYGSPVGVFVRADSTIESMEDVKRSTVALVPSTVEFQLFADQDLAAKALETFNNDDTIEAVAIGDADAGAMSSAILDTYLARRPELRRLPVSLDNFAFAIGVPKGDGAFLEFLNAQVYEIVRQGYLTLAELVRKRSLQRDADTPN